MKDLPVFLENIGLGKSPFEQLVISFEAAAEMVKCGNRPFILYGAGATCPHVLKLFADKGLSPICLGDSDISKAGQRINDIEILTPEQAIKFAGNDAVCFIAIWTAASFYEDMLYKLRGWGYNEIYFLDTNIQPRVPPEPCIVEDVQKNRDGITTCLNKLCDETSRLRFIDFTHSFLTGKLKNDASIFFYSPGEYPSKDGSSLNNDILKITDSDYLIHCRCGHKDDTETYLSELINVKGACLFEPTRAGRMVAKEFFYASGAGNALVLPYMLSDSEGRTAFDEKYHFSRYMDLEAYKVREAETIALDDIIGDVCPTVINLDMTGGYIEALRGMAKTLERYRPLLMISGFRKVSEALEIMTEFPELKYYMRCFGGITMREGYTLFARVKE